VFILRRELNALILIDGTALLGVMEVCIDLLNAYRGLSTKERQEEISHGGTEEEIWGLENQRIHESKITPLLPCASVPP
jgi:hypothetical protein